VTKWPSMKPRVLRPRHGGEVIVDATVTLDGKCLVAALCVGDVYLTPTEAERVAKALVHAAEVSRRKRQFAAKPKRAYRRKAKP
jgi:hypothetical protein